MVNNIFELSNIVSKANTFLFNYRFPVAKGGEWKWIQILCSLILLVECSYHIGEHCQIKYIIVHRLNDSAVFSGKRFLWWSLESSHTKIPDTHSTMFCSVQFFFSWYWQLQIREESSVDVWWLCACAHASSPQQCWWKTLPVLLCCKKNFQVSTTLSETSSGWLLR